MSRVISLIASGLNHYRGSKFPSIVQATALHLAEKGTRPCYVPSQDLTGTLFTVGYSAAKSTLSVYRGKIEQGLSSYKVTNGPLKLIRRLFKKKPEKIVKEYGEAKVRSGQHGINGDIFAQGNGVDPAVKGFGGGDFGGFKGDRFSFGGGGASGSWGDQVVKVVAKNRPASDVAHQAIEEVASSGPPSSAMDLVEDILKKFVEAN